MDNNAINILGLMEKHNRFTRNMILMKNVILNSSLNGYHKQNMNIESCFRDNDYEFYEVSLLNLDLKFIKYYKITFYNINCMMLLLI